MYLGQLATAAVADMPVGAPSPCASALEQAPDRTRTSGAWPGSALTASAVEELPASMITAEGGRPDPTDLGLSYT